MDIEKEVLSLVATTNRTEQAVKDLTGYVVTMNNENKNLNARLVKVENRQWYFSGLGTAIGAIIGYGINMWKR
jgi:hypothetical protein